MSQQNSNIQPSINTPSQNSPSISQNVQKISSTTGIQSSKNIQILNPLNSNINLNQTSGLTFTLENNNVKPSSLKINQMTGSTITLIPAINSGNSNTAQTNPLNSSNVSSSVSQTNTNSSNSSSGTSTYGGFAYCSNCGEYGVKAAFYGKSKLYCSVACQNGIKKQQQQQQQNHGIKRTVEALNQSPSHVQNVLQHTTTSSNTSSTSNSIPNISQSKSGHSSYSKSGQPTISSLLSQQSLLSKQNDSLHQNSEFNTNLLPSSMVMSPVSNNVCSTFTQSPTIAASAKRARKTSNSSISASNSNTDSNQPFSINSSSGSVLSQQSVNNSQNTANDVKTFSVPNEPFKPILESSYNWISYFEQHPDSLAAPVNAFKHVPLTNEWLKLINNLKVEVPNRDQPPFHILERKPSQDQLYWFATVIKISGYWLKLRYIGFEEDSSSDFWMHINDKALHYIGWATDNQHFLTPPMKIITRTYTWEDYIIKKILNSRTLPKNLAQKISQSLSSKFRKGMLLELVDKKALGQMRVAKIIENIGGRLRLKYESKTEFDDFWCHEQSDLIHPVGWSVSVGHKIISSPEYQIESASKHENNDFLSNDCTPDMFVKTKIYKKNENNAKFRKNMKLEAIDPLNLSSIAVATITEILSDGYLMVEIDGCNEENGKFCYHSASSSLLPAGFCARNKITLQKPLNYKKKFDWETYLKETKSEYAPPKFFTKENKFENPFRVGMKLESVDLMEPKFICVATVVAVVDRLIRLNFDGWDQKYDQWVDFESCDIYPIGWCHLVGYKLEEPPKNNERRQKTKSRKVSN